MKRALRRIVFFALLHFVVAMVIGAIAFGLDFDQLRSRSAVSRAAAVVHDILWFPHDSVLRALPVWWKIANHRWLTPVAIIANSLLWGVVLAVIEHRRPRMFASKPAMATVAVKDLQKARKFYEQTLGLTVEHEEGEEALSFKASGSSLLVYRSEFAGTNRATAVTWDAGGDVVRLVDDLKKKGVKFERYDMPGMRHEGDVYVADGMRVAWFKDPDGNIHAIVGT